MPVDVAYLIHTLCGALILLIFYAWLRRKTVENVCLLWISISLLSWSAVRFISFMHVGFGMDLTTEKLLYFVSPVSTVLFTKTGFRLARVRHTFQTPDLRVWPKIATITVTAISVVACVLLILGENQPGKHLDAFASSIALAILGGGLAYSFNSYGHRFLAWVTAMTFLGFISRQYYVASYGSPTNLQIISLYLANSILMIMLFVALAVAWCFSDPSPLKVVGVPAHVDIVAICVDLRGSTQWANQVAEKDFRYVKTFLDGFIQWVLSNAKASRLGRPSYAKFLGDGVLIVWEIPEEAMAESVNIGVKLGCHLYRTYPSWVRKNARKYTWGVPVGIGVGVDVGTAIRLTFENGPNDYVGAPVSYAPKMQDFARPNGGVVVQEKVYNLLNGSRSKFIRQETLRIGAGGVGVRITK
ncbi:MAG TPA: hypothetical protein VGC87_02920 [Pyrinomonadaceae bacterium]|jgi:class 3 adenylate cyclase